MKGECMRKKTRNTSGGHIYQSRYLNILSPGLFWWKAKAEYSRVSPPSCDVTVFSCPAANWTNKNRTKKSNSPRSHSSRCVSTLRCNSPQQHNYNSTYAHVITPQLQWTSKVSISFAIYLSQIHDELDVEPEAYTDGGLHWAFLDESILFPSLVLSSFPKFLLASLLTIFICLSERCRGAAQVLS